MTELKIKFKPEIEKQISSGKACAFIDHKKYESVDGVFVLQDRLYNIIEIDRVLFYDWTSYYYKVIGLGSELEAIKWWKDNNPKEFDGNGTYIGPQDFFLHYFAYFGGKQ